MKAKTAANSLIFGLSAALILILVNVFTAKATSKIDLTEHGIYTLTEASQSLMHGLPERVVVKAYFGNLPPEHAQKQEYVMDLLAEYARASGGKFVLEKIDPWNKPELEAQLQKDGVPKLLLLTQQKDKQEQVPCYFAVQFNYLDKKEVWNPGQQAMFSVAGLEYNFSTILKRLAYGRKKIGVTQGFGEPEQFQAIQHPQIGLADLYEIVPLNWEKNPKALADVDGIIVNGPTRKVSGPALYALDQHLMHGKPTVMLVRGVSWQPGNNAPSPAGGDTPYLGTPADHGLKELLAHYGFEVQSNTVIDGRAAVQGIIPMGREPLLTQAFFPLTQVLAGERYGVLEGLEAVVMPFVSTVKLVGPLAGGAFPGGEVKSLLRTSPTSFTRADVLAITRNMQIQMTQDGKGPYDVAWAASGSFKSFFAGKPVPTATPEEALASSASDKTVEASPPSTRLIVVGGTDFAEDKTFGIMRAVQNPVYMNGYRALHAMVDWAVQDTALAVVRAKEVERPLLGVDPSKRLLVKYGNIAGAPLSLILFGLVYWRVRERRRRHVSL